MQSNLNFGVTICRLIELVAPKFGCHVALTGGSLYKDGDRKDLDIIFYRIRQQDKIDTEGLFNQLQAIGFDFPVGKGWCFKSKFNGVSIDMLFPENQGGEYNRVETTIKQQEAPQAWIPPAAPMPMPIQAPSPVPVMPPQPVI